MFRLFPEDENSTLQTGRETYDFHSPSSFDTRIGEWASAKGKPYIFLSLFDQPRFFSFVFKILLLIRSSPRIRRFPFCYVWSVVNKFATYFIFALELRFSTKYLFFSDANITSRYTSRLKGLIY